MMNLKEEERGDQSELQHFSFFFESSITPHWHSHLTPHTNWYGGTVFQKIVELYG